MRQYWIPIIVFGALTLVETSVDASWYPAFYVLKAAIVTTSLWFCREPFREISWNARLIVPSVLIGIGVFVAWVGLDRVLHYPRLGGRTGFDPNVLRGSWEGPVFLAVRFYGLVLMVPVMEEIFWRSFLLRYLTDHDFRRIQVGTFSASALVIMVVASATAHPEWLAAVVASLAYALWLKHTRNLFGTIVAHATTNAALGGYVLITGEWHYW